jgi:hypothetical protein
VEDLFHLQKIGLAKLLEIRTGGEMPSFAAEHEDPDPLVFGDLVHHPSYRGPHGDIDGVQLLRTTQGDYRDATPHVQGDGNPFRRSLQL